MLRDPRLATNSARFACLGLCVVLSACEPGILNPAGPIAAGERSIFFNSLTVMLAIVVPVIVLAFAFGWWFRAGNTRARHLPEWAYSGRLELLVWSIPALAIMFLGGIAWIGSHDLDPPKPIASRAKTMTVEVVATDWKWLFLYPEQGIATINRLVVPVGTPVKFRITSAGVMNSFFVPQLGSQIYAMSGMDSTLHLRADKAGRYRGLSAHYSGRALPIWTSSSMRCRKPPSTASSRPRGEGRARRSTGPSSSPWRIPAAMSAPPATPAPARPVRPDRHEERRARG